MQDTPTHKRGAGVGFVYETLRNEIVELKLKPGSAMDEVQLSARFAMSRTPIREAMVRLLSEGLLVALPNRATIVAQIDFLNLPHFFDALTLMYRVTTRLAAANHGADAMKAIEARQADFVAAVARRDALAMIATNRDFHLEIARAGGNVYYTDMFTRLLDEGRRILRLYYSSFNDMLPRPYVDEHEALIAAISQRAVDEADMLAAAHARQIIGHIQTAVSADARVNAEITL
ncbi:GntR family transcriptional regulator [Aureimonas sp. OT7]|nr:GntR family transcriptional regulator [Aureimonas sp. OT7]